MSHLFSLDIQCQPSEAIKNVIFNYVKQKSSATAPDEAELIVTYLLGQSRLSACSIICKVVR